MKPMRVYRSHFERLKQKPKKPRRRKLSKGFPDTGNLPFVPP